MRCIGIFFDQVLGYPKHHDERPLFSVKTRRSCTTRCYPISRGLTTPQTAVWFSICSVRGYIRWAENHRESNSPQKTTTPSTISCYIRIQCPPSNSLPYVFIDVQDSLSRDFQNWYSFGTTWNCGASEIVNEQALEERARPLKISDNIVCLCYY